MKYNDNSFKDGMIDVSNIGLFSDINSDGDISYTIKPALTDGGSAELIDKNTIKVTRAGKFDVTLSVQETADYKAGNTTAVLNVERAEGKGTVTIGDIREGEILSPTAQSSTNGVIGVTYEYSINEKGPFNSETPTTPGTYYVRAHFIENDLYNSCFSAPAAFKIIAKPFAVTAEQEKKNTLDLNAGLKIDQKGSQIIVKWGKVADADTYEVYLSYCGKVFRAKPDITTSKTSAKLKKIRGKKLDLKKNFKLYVASYKTIDGGKIALGRTITGHVVGRKNKKYTNVKNIKINKTIVELSVGEKYSIKAKTVFVDKKKKQLTNDHAKEFRYSTSDNTIANVDGKGRIYGIGKGTCYVYVYARNGYSKKITVKVD